jgi:LmbE family N-acetylglucosaminyl deacetylase
MDRKCSFLELILMILRSVVGLFWLISLVSAMIAIYVVNHSFQPDIVFAHSSSDIHQDHSVVTTEALRAFRGRTVLGFDVLRSTYGFFPHFLVEVQEDDVERKVKALAQYKTYLDVYYFDPDITRSTLVRHGALAERPYAEGFDILRIVGAFNN